MAKPLYCASTNTVTLSQGNPEGTPSAATLRFVLPDTTTLTPAAPVTYADGVLSCVVAAGEVPLAGEGAIWTAQWAFTYDDVTSLMVESYLLVVSGNEPPVVGEVLVEVGTNSYVTTLEAANYMVGRETAAWAAATTEQRSRALMLAAQRIDAMRLRGIKYDSAQAMQFPRLLWGRGSQTYSSENERYSSMSDTAGWTGSGTVPQAVKDAQCEEALAIINASASDTDRLELQNQGVTSVRIGDFYETYAGVRKSDSNTMVIRSMEALALLRPYLAGNAKFV